MYFGLLFLSLYNQKSHPDLDLMATIVRLNRLEAGINEPVKKFEVQKFAKGKDIEDKKLVPMTEKERKDLISNLKYLGVDTDLYFKRTNDVVKPPVIPDVEEVEEKASEYFEELLVLASVEEQIQHWMNSGKLLLGGKY
ncbi:Uncharacterised protein [Mycobacteroides abscessus subsp. abscessus]|nr:Uncharacterised protein [Mycobacteroides abscessus subsp. abscessus]